MKIKVGQWVRFKNDIMAINKIEKKDNITWLYVNGGIFSAFGYEMYKNDIKIANTPQELIEVGDLIMLGCICEVERVYDKKVNVGMFSYEHKEITKILTPKGKDYICQWEVE